MNEQNKNSLQTFIKEYWGYLLVCILSLGVFIYCIQGELQVHIAYKEAEKQGDLLAMGEMKVNGSGIIREDHTIVLPTESTMYGPYFDYGAGSYVLSVTFHASEAVTGQSISVTASGGTEQIGTYPLQEGENLLQVDLEKDQKRVEIVLRNEGTGELEVKELTFTSGTVPGWGEQQEEPEEQPSEGQSVEETAGIDLLSDMQWKENAIFENGVVTLYQGDYMYGPYMDLETGTYQIYINCNYDQQLGGLTVQVTAENGSQVLATQDLQPGENMIQFSVEDYTKGMEIVLRNEIFDSITISKVELNQER